MGEGPNDWEWQLGLATHEWKAAEYPVLTGLGTEGPGLNLGHRPHEGRTICGEAGTRKPGGDGTANGGGVRRRESPKCVETRSKEPGQSWRGWDDHRRRQGLPA